MIAEMVNSLIRLKSEFIEAFADPFFVAPKEIPFRLTAQTQKRSEYMLEMRSISSNSLCI